MAELEAALATEHEAHRRRVSELQKRHAQEQAMLQEQVVALRKALEVCLMFSLRKHG